MTRTALHQTRDAAAAARIRLADQVKRRKVARDRRSSWILSRTEVTWHLQVVACGEWATMALAEWLARCRKALFAVHIGNVENVL